MLLVEAKIEHKQGVTHPFALKRGRARRPCGMMSQQLFIGMHHVGIGGHRRDRDRPAIFERDGDDTIAVGLQPSHLHIQL